jgi:hypothetical protein
MTADGNLSAWGQWQLDYRIVDLRAFVIVAYLHAGGYLGALAGLVLAIVYVRKRLARNRSAAPGAAADRPRA